MSLNSIGESLANQIELREEGAPPALAPKDQATHGNPSLYTLRRKRVEDLMAELTQTQILSTRQAAAMELRVLIDAVERLEHALCAQRDKMLTGLSVLQSHCESMATANWREWEELASAEEFERWVKSRAAHMAAQAKATIATVKGE